MTGSEQIPTAPYGYATQDPYTRTVHVVDGDGWDGRTLRGIPDSLHEEFRHDCFYLSALALCGMGLNRPAEWPDDEAGQKWCRRCTSPTYREALRTRLGFSPE